MAFDEKIEHYMLTYPHAEEPPRSIIKTPAQIEGIRKAGEINSMVLDSVAEMIGEGVSTQEIDDLVAKRTAELGGICASVIRDIPKMFVLPLMTLSVTESRIQNGFCRAAIL